MVNNKPFEQLTRSEITALAPMQRHGVDGTDAAHKLSIELCQYIISRLSGARITNTDSQRAVARLLQAADNLRMKTAQGNRVIDHMLDRGIADRNKSGQDLNGRQAMRAMQAYKSACKMGASNETMARVADFIGSLRVTSGDIKNESIAGLANKLAERHKAEAIRYTGLSCNPNALTNCKENEGKRHS